MTKKNLILSNNFLIDLYQNMQEVATAVNSTMSMLYRSIGKRINSRTSKKQIGYK